MKLHKGAVLLTSGVEDAAKIPGAKVKRRFEASCIPVTETGCWLWIKSCNPRGYGHFYFNEKICQAHRVSWEIYKGIIPEGLHVLHRCDVRSCVNPEHLFLGTHLVNMRDMMQKKRHRHFSITHCPKGHEYTEETSRFKNGRRVCRVCDKIYLHNKRTSEEFKAARRIKRKAEYKAQRLKDGKSYKEKV